MGKIVWVLVWENKTKQIVLLELHGTFMAKIFNIIRAQNSRLSMAKSRFELPRQVKKMAGEIL
jgi:hypothetical protein